MIKLGKTYTDNITGFTGVATSRTVYLWGCVHVGLTPPMDKDGKLPRIEFFDEDRLDSESKVSTGGPADHPPQLRPR